MKWYIWNCMENGKTVRAKCTWDFLRLSFGFPFDDAKAFRYIGFPHPIFQSMFQICTVPVFSVFHCDVHVYVCTRKVLYILLCRHPHFQSIFPYSMLSDMRCCVLYANFVNPRPQANEIFPLCTGWRTERAQFLVEVVQSKIPFEFFCFSSQQSQRKIHWQFFFSAIEYQEEKKEEKI